MKWLQDWCCRNNLGPDNPASDSNPGETLNWLVTTASVKTDTAKASSALFFAGVSAGSTTSDSLDTSLRRNPLKVDVVAR